MELSEHLALLEAEPKVADGLVLDIHIVRTELLSALNAVFGVIPVKGFKPILTNFHLKAEDGFLRVSGSDTALSVTQRVPIQTTKVAGAAIFPAAQLLALARDAAAEVLHLRVTVKKGQYFAVIKTQTTTWNLSLGDPAGFPDFSGYESVPMHAVNRLGFLHALQKVRKSASLDPMRPYLMLVDVLENKMRASDSHRFAQIKFKFPFACQIPVGAAHEVVQRLTSSNLENVEVGRTERALLFGFGKTLLIAQTIGFEFPDIDELLLKPTLENDQDLSVSRKALLAAIRRTRITADTDTSAVVLSLNKGWVTVQTKDYSGGTAIESVEAVWEYAPRHVCFNHQYLTDLLNSTDSDTCVFRLGKDLKTRPTPLLMEDPAEGFTAVLSQIRIDWMD